MIEIGGGMVAIYQTEALNDFEETASGNSLRYFNYLLHSFGAASFAIEMTCFRLRNS